MCFTWNSRKLFRNKGVFHVKHIYEKMMFGKGDKSGRVILRRRM